MPGYDVGIIGAGIHGASHRGAPCRGHVPVGERPAFPLHADLVGGYYFRPEGSELFLMGSLHPGTRASPDRFEESISDREIEALFAPLVHRAPELELAEVHGGWASLYDVSPDFQPVIGEIAPGVFVDAGTSGHGFKLAPALGGHVADLVLGDPPPGPVQPPPVRAG